MKHVLLESIWRGRGGGVFSSDRRTMVAAQRLVLCAAAEFVKLDIISICKELL